MAANPCRKTGLEDKGQQPHPSYVRRFAVRNRLSLRNGEGEEVVVDQAAVPGKSPVEEVGLRVEGGRKLFKCMFWVQLHYQSTFNNLFKV